MGALGRILITGAGGYVGRYTVRLARARGWQVRALVRREDAIRPRWHDDPGIEPVVLDLAHDRIAPALDGVDVVIHAAAALRGDDIQHGGDTLVPTERLVGAMGALDPPPRLVLTGSVAVYSGLKTRRGAVVTEATPIEAQPDRRDAYTRAKLAQEGVIRRAGLSAWILRMGAVFGPARLWNAHLGVMLGPVLIRLGNRGEIPLVYVHHAAEALLAAAALAPEGVEVVNIVDNDLPDRRRFLRAMGDARPRVILPLSWRVPMLAGRLLGWLPLDPPGLLSPPVIAARLKPMRYDNTHARTRLGWLPDIEFEAAMRAALEGEDA